MKAIKWVLILLAGLFVLALIFSFAEEQHARSIWQSCYDEVKAKGGSLEWKDYIPPDVPDDQNFFKAPKMQDWFQQQPYTPGIIINTTNELSGLKTNPDTLKTITSKEAAMAYLGWSDQFGPDFALIREALQRPCVRIDGNYSRSFEIPLVNFVTMRSLSQVSAQRAKCYLLLGQPDKALDELTFLNQLRQILEFPPSGKTMTLVSAMINVAIAGLYVNTITNGLQSHAWQNSQLVILQEQLRQMNLTPFLVNAIWTENAENYQMIYSDLLPRVHGNGVRAYFMRAMLLQNSATITKIDQQAIDDIDRTNNIISPNKLDELNDQATAISKHSYWPGNALAAIAIPNYAKAWQTTAHNQTLINQAQIVCALERYRLAYGQYPDTLAALSPQFMEKVPYDVIGGQPLHYIRKPDGSFLLYSVGWNEIDDGGVPSPHSEFGTITNYMTGDWVWPN